MSLLEENWKTEKSRKLKKNHTLSHHPEKTTYKHSVFSSTIRPLTLHPTPPPRLLFCIKPRMGHQGGEWPEVCLVNKVGGFLIVLWSPQWLPKARVRRVRKWGSGPPNLLQPELPTFTCSTNWPPKENCTGQKISLFQKSFKTIQERLILFPASHRPIRVLAPFTNPQSLSCFESRRSRPGLSSARVPPPQDALSPWCLLGFPVQ